jgi:hypothetical protein
MRVLCDPVSFLQFMRCIVVERLTEASILLNKLDAWHKTEALASKKSKPKLVTVMIELRDLVKRDEVDFKELLVKLPSYSELQRSIGDVGDAAWQKTVAAKHAKTPSMASIFAPGITGQPAAGTQPVSLAATSGPLSPAPSQAIAISAAATGGLVSPATPSSSVSSQSSSATSSPSQPMSPAPAPSIVLNSPTAVATPKPTPAVSFATAPLVSPAVPKKTASPEPEVSPTNAVIALDESEFFAPSTTATPLSPVINDVTTRREAAPRDTDLFDEPERPSRSLPRKLPVSAPSKVAAKQASKSEDDALIASIEVNLMAELAAAGASPQVLATLVSGAPSPSTNASSRPSGSSGGSSMSIAPSPVAAVQAARSSSSAAAPPVPTPPTQPVRTSGATAPPPVPATSQQARTSTGAVAPPIPQASRPSISLAASPPPSPAVAVAAKLATAPAKSPSPPVPPVPVAPSKSSVAPVVPPPVPKAPVTPSATVAAKK